MCVTDLCRGLRCAMLWCLLHVLWLYQCAVTEESHATFTVALALHVAAATTVCFAEKTVITAPVLKTAIQQIMNMSPLPVILMRTVSTIALAHWCGVVSI